MSSQRTLIEDFVELVTDELKKQDQKWGENREKHPLEWQSILIEEVGEVGKEMNDNSFSNTLPPTYEEELVQVVACAFRMYEQNRVNLFGKDHKKNYK